MLRFVQISDSKLDVSITDNGDGFDTTLLAKGHGMINMHQRADEIVAVFVVNSTNGKGITVGLQTKINQ